MGCREIKLYFCDFKNLFWTVSGRIQTGYTMYGHGLAVLAGFCACMAAACAKLAFNQDVVNSIYKSICFLVHVQQNQALSEQAMIVTRVVFILLLFVFNGLMWTLFVKSLQKCSNSVEATVINTASNFLFSGIVGWVIFQEKLSLLWWIGASFIIQGIIIIRQSSKEEEMLQNENNKDKSL